VDHIIVDYVGTYVSSMMEEIKWNAQGKGIFIGHFISSVIDV
jgi:hypothetical protein